jgi:ADP-ribose pyrophosphatase YjhB (NUDIX family)
MPDWVKDIRRKIGKDLLIINSAGGWIENDKGDLLLQKRSAVDEHWGFPGGIVELGESASETAIREIEEETGLITTAVELLGVYSKYFLTFDNGDKCQTYSVFFRMNVVSGDLRVDNLETHALSYFPLNALPPIYYEQHRDVISDVMAGKIPAFR